MRDRTGESWAIKEDTGRSQQLIASFSEELATGFQARGIRIQAFGCIWEHENCLLDEQEGFQVKEGRLLPVLASFLATIIPRASVMRTSGDLFFPLAKPDGSCLFHRGWQWLWWSSSWIVGLPCVEVAVASQLWSSLAGKEDLIWTDREDKAGVVSTWVGC